jgi:hypothetical protein
MRARTSQLFLVVLLSVASTWAASKQPTVSYTQQPIAFEPNRGQTNSEVKYLARGSGYALFLTPREAVLAMRHANAKDSALRIRWVAADPAATLQPEQELAGRVNYLRGNNSAKWITDVPTFEKVRLARVYDGIDLVVYGSNRNFEYDFVVTPHANAKQIRLGFEGAHKVSLDNNGDLILQVGDDELRQHKPVVYQNIGGKRKIIDGRFLLANDHTASLAIGDYDHNQPLIIDPTLSYSTYLGGTGEDRGNSIAVDGSGHAYITGETSSTDFPVKGGVQTNKASADAFVTKMWATGGGVIYSTYLGGSSVDRGTAIAVDRFGNAYVGGETDSTDFPVTAGAFRPTYTGAGDGFVTKLSPSGSSLVYSLVLGGEETDSINALALDSQQRAYVTGGTSSQAFPVKNPYQSTYTSQPPSSGGISAFITRVNASGSDLEYSTYLDGGIASLGYGVAVDSTFHAYITGWTSSPDFPTTTGAFQRVFKAPTHPGDPHDTPGLSGFVTKFSADGRTLGYSTFLGGTGDDVTTAIAVDSSNRAYLTGSAQSPDYPVKAGGFQTTRRGSSDAFVTKLQADGAGLIYSTFLGGSAADGGSSIAVNSAGRAFVTGSTSSSNFPVKNAIDATYNGHTDAFVTEVWATGGGLQYSTYLGGSTGPSATNPGEDAGVALRLDGNSNAYVTGYTRSSNFPTTTGAYRRTLRGPQDAFVVKIAP